MNATEELEYANRQHENADRQARYAGFWDIDHEEIEWWEKNVEGNDNQDRIIDLRGYYGQCKTDRVKGS
jgi:hypothetical protein